MTAKRSTLAATDGTRARARQTKQAPAPAAPQDEAPPSRKGQRTRERLLEAAKGVFEEQGFLNARISDIGIRADQSHGSFYYYFQSKEQVFRELAAAVDERLFAPLDEVILAESDHTPLRQRIREATRRHLESYRREARMMDLIEQVSRYDPEINELRIVRHKRNTERVTKAIRQLQRAGIADPSLDPKIVATALGGLTQRFAELWFVHNAIDCTMELAVEQLSRLYENALQLTPEKKRR